MYDRMTCFLPGSYAPPDRVEVNEWGRGNVRNFRVQQRPDGIVLVGSLGKFLHGENATTLTRQGVREALASVEAETGLSLQGGTVWSLETGATLPVREPPSAYLTAWGPLPRYKKHTHGAETITYSTGSRSYSGYDKQAESGPLGGIMQDRFALRLELRVKRGMKALHGRYLSPWELAEPDAYLVHVRLWSEYYFKIPKRREVICNMDGITTKQVARTLATIGLQSMGLDRMEAIIREAQQSGGIDRVTACRIRVLVRELQKDTRISSTEENTAELDDKVRTIMQTAR